MSKGEIIRSEARGHRHHGWLETYHSFSFGDYYDPRFIQFGALRVLNEDFVAPARGFATHPHHNMEIITLPLEGELEHRDSMGHAQLLRPGEVQVMSAGTGIYHSERNPSPKQTLHLLQIWVIPESLNVAPRYQQDVLPNFSPDAFFTFLGPRGSGLPFWIHQQAWFSLAHLQPGSSTDYQPKDSGNGLYFFIVNGEVKIGEALLKAGDAFAVSKARKIAFTSSPDQEARVLAMEVPMRGFN
ncbi:MAG: pirin family protein [Flavobacteriales bacterium]|nr:pirin family protein [Flavobacteriales bacterium]